MKPPEAPSLAQPLPRAWQGQRASHQSIVCGPCPSNISCLTFSPLSTIHQHQGRGNSVILVAGHALPSTMTRSSPRASR
jgi:hypothetical protein